MIEREILVDCEGGVLGLGIESD